MDTPKDLSVNIYTPAKESELEALLCKYPEYLEKGLKFIDRQVNTTRGPLDILAIDSGNCLVIVELKIYPDDGMLFQVLDYFGWVYENIDSIKRMYPNFDIDYKQVPRIFLVAPDFSESLQRRVRYIRDDIRIQIFRYKLTKHKGDILFIPFEIQPSILPVPPTQPTTFDDFINYIQDEGLRTLYQNTYKSIVELSSDNQEKFTTQYINIRHKGDTFVMLWAFRKAIDIGYYELPSKEWKHIRIEDPASFKLDEFIDNQKRVLAKWDKWEE